MAVAQLSNETATDTYEEIIDFLAQLDPAKIVAYRAPEAAKARVEELIAREKTDGLTQEEAAELERFMQLERILSLVKARARCHLRASDPNE